MKKIESGQYTPQDLDLFQELQWNYARRLITRTPEGIVYGGKGKRTTNGLNPYARTWGEEEINDYKKMPLRK